MSVHWLKDLPAGSFFADYLHRRIVITPEAFESIGDYTQSMPTHASPGRIYRKNWHWSGPPSNWFVYICWRDPADEKFTLHFPLRPFFRWPNWGRSW